MRTVAAIFLLIFAWGCQSQVPKGALAMKETTLEQRQLQTRMFQSGNEGEILSACAGVLQDLGFTIDASETPLGLVMASKDRDATDAGQVAGAVLVAVLFRVATPVDDVQKIRVSIVSNSKSRSETAVRVTFQRVIWNTHGQVSRLELLDDVELYSQFFDKLSKAVFLEAHEL